ncbi:MAG TPA: RagB/SusD family nutrient uptake outer membrane protein [Bacteroidetes bacterium]|nr:RagB/SusD family nutrient uptake outer membrane protein [Bacteroidota bacterium]
MKATFKIFILLLIVFSITNTGCKKFLDEELLGNQSDAQFYQSASDAELALAGIYNALSFADANNRIWVFGDVASDDAAKGGIPGDQADIGRIDDFDITTTNGNIENVWDVDYEGISRANWLLDRIGGINMNQQRKDEIIGEAKFLRAYFYYWLANIFGDIPVHTKVPTPSEMQKAATPYQEVYSEVIIPDLEDAVSKLPETADPGRATKYSALGLLAKCYLFMKNWPEAENAANQIIKSGLYRLDPLYRNNFEQAAKDNPEIIFSIQHLPDQNPWLGNRLNQWFAPRANNGYGFDAPTQNFVDEFEMTVDSVVDPRLDYTIGRQGHIWYDSVMFDPSWSPTGYLNRKYIQPLSEVPVESKADGELNYQFMRYSEVLLIMAEALNEQGKPGEAVNYVNKVRTRARESYKNDPKLPGYPNIPDGLLPDIQDNGQADVGNAIRHERRVELGFEFHRYFDIIRYGPDYANKAFKDKPNFNYKTNKFMPIPQAELNTNFELGH